jgi:hypothetical protein
LPSFFLSGCPSFLSYSLLSNRFAFPDYGDLRSPL